MRVKIDEARRDKLAARIDFLGRVAWYRADLRDQAVLYGDIAGEAGITGAIHDGPVANDKVECGPDYVLLSPRKKVTHCNRYIQRFSGGSFEHPDGDRPGDGLRMPVRSR